MSKSNFDAIQYDGVSATPGSTAVTVQSYDSSGYVTRASGTSVPSAEAGYAKGCIFLDTNATGANIFLVNQGSTTSCSFVTGTATTDFASLTDVTSAPFAANTYAKSDGSNVVGGIVIATHTATNGNVLVANGTNWNTSTPDSAGLVAKSGSQTGIAGDKTWTGAQAFSSTIAANDDVTIATAKKIKFKDANNFIQEDGSDNLDITSGGAIDMSSTGAAADWTHTATGAAQDLTFALAGAVDSSLILQSAGTGSDAIKMNATAGDIDIDAIAGKDITINAGQVLIEAEDDAANAIRLKTNTGTSETITIVNTLGTGAAAIAVTATAGGVDVDAAAGLDVNIAGGQVALVSKDNAASAISLTANVGTSETIVATNTQGTGEGAITLTATAGGIDINAATGKNVTVDAGQFLVTSIEDVASAIAFTTNTGTSETIVLTNTQGTGESAITIAATAGGVNVDAAAAKDLDLAGGQVKLVSKDDAAGAISLTANIGTSETITVTNTQGTAAGAITFTATAGGVDIDAAAAKDVDIAGGQVLIASKDDVASAITLTANVGTSETIVVTNTQGTGEGAITLTSTAGGVDVDAAAAKDVNIAGGQVALVSKDDAASAISMTTNIGTSETIVITNTQGTADPAITIDAAAGGMALEIGSGKTLAVATDGAAHTVNMFTGNGVQTVNIATHATPANVVTIGGAASTLNVKAAAGVTLPAFNYGSSSAGNDTYAVTLAPAPAALTTGMMVLLNVDVANTGACTLNVNGTGDISIKNCDGNDPQNGDLNADTLSLLAYNGTFWCLLNPVLGH